MKRAFYKELLAWKNSSDRKPLIIKGARQVGKTYLLRKFGEEQYGNVIYLNFETDKKLQHFFEDNLSPEVLIPALQTYFTDKILPQKTLIIFDEVQVCSTALNSLKYFCEFAPQYHIAAAGSLLGVKLAGEAGFPVGKVTFKNLYPLNFFEFLDAMGKSQHKALLLEMPKHQAIPTPLHEQLIDLLKQYFLIGGMPEAVKAYLKHGDYQAVRQVQQDILSSYLLDFSKYAPPRQIINITSVWEAIPVQLAKENKKFIFSAIRKSARAHDYQVALKWLEDAGLIYKSNLIKAPKLPLAAYVEQNAFKVFMLDVGLLGAMSALPPQAILEGDLLFVEFHGAFAENYIAQSLTCQHPLYYWASNGTAEIDFVIQDGLAILPLEVKAGTSKKKKSLQVYAQRYQPEQLGRLSLMNFAHDGAVINYPLYAAGLLLNQKDNQ